MDPQTLIQHYLDGELDAQALDTLSDWLAQSEANREAFVRASMLDTQIQEHLLSTDLHQFLDQVDIHAIQDAIAEKPSDQSGAFLATMDAAAAPAKPATDQPITLRHAVSLLSWAGTRTASQLLRQHAGRLAIAAALAIAMSLTLIFLNTAGPNEDIAEHITEHTDQAAPAATTRTVATLTSTHNATWAGPTSAAPGDSLHAGQRLTLTAGFAEITTTRGAKAILQAPATIELTNNENTIRLHTGKLVGICETNASKGFVVHTPHMDITDLGTRFGVDVSPYRWTEVHVHQGQVHVANPKTPTSVPAQRQRVYSNQAVRMDAVSDKLAVIEPAFEKFNEAIASRRLFSTGFDLPEGSLDLRWQIVADGKGPLDQPIPLRVQYGERPDNHFAAQGNDPAKAQWLTFAPGYPLYGDPRRPDLDRSTITIECRFDLPESVGLDNATFALKYASSYGLTELRINGTHVQAVPRQTNADRRQNTYRQIELLARGTALRPGQNIIEIDVPEPVRATQAHLMIYFYAELRPSAATPHPSTGEPRL